MNDIEQQYAQLPDRDGRAHPEQGVAVGAQGSHHPHGHAEGRAQVADRRERGLHLHGAAADEEPEFADAGARQSRRRPVSTRSTEDRANFSATIDMQQDLRDVFDEANRQNVSLYPVDPRGLAVFEFDLSEPRVGSDMDRQYLNATMDTLRTLAEQHRRPRHREPQRSGGGHEADRARQQRLLPGRLQLDASRRRTESSTRSRCA